MPKKRAKRQKLHCENCPESQTYKRAELRSYKKKLYCEFHITGVSLIRCFKCSAGNSGWPRSEIRYHRKLAYCPEHFPTQKLVIRPSTCPDCGEEFDSYTWRGSVEATTIHCFCGFSGRALDYDDAMTIQILASPLEER